MRQIFTQPHLENSGVKDKLPTCICSNTSGRVENSAEVVWGLRFSLIPPSLVKSDLSILQLQSYLLQILSRYLLARSQHCPPTSEQGAILTFVKVSSCQGGMFKTSQQWFFTVLLDLSLKPSSENSDTFYLLDKKSIIKQVT